MTHIFSLVELYNVLVICYEPELNKSKNHDDLTK